MLSITPLNELEIELELKRIVYQETKKREQTEKFDNILKYLLDTFSVFAINRGVENAIASYTYYNSLFRPPSRNKQEITPFFRELDQLLETSESALFLTYAKDKLDGTGFAIAIQRQYADIPNSDLNGTHFKKKNFDRVEIILGSADGMESYLESLSKWQPYNSVSLIFKSGESLTEFFKIHHAIFSINKETLFEFKQNNSDVIITSTDSTYTSDDNTNDNEIVKHGYDEIYEDVWEYLKVKKSDFLSSLCVTFLLILIFLLCIFGT